MSGGPSGGSSSTGGSRPFYELPSSIKSCSKIIQETRLELSGGKSSGASGNNAWGDSQRTQMTSSSGSSSNYSASILRSKSSIGDVLNSTSSRIPSDGPIRPVHTQRPFTPRDSDNLWGVSSRKRPPSAITLSRLSLDDIDETRPLSSSRLKYFKDSPIHRPGSSSKKFGAFGHHSLDELESRREELTDVRAKMKGMLGSPGAVPEDHFYAEMGALNLGDNRTPTKGKSLDGQVRLASARGRSTSSSTDDELTNVLELLDSFLQSPGPKEECIEILKRLNGKLEDFKAVEKVRSRLLKLIFQLVEKNQQDEDILFWASFILLHCHIIGTNLTTVFKMIFKASRSKDYREVIQEDQEYLNLFMDSFSQVCPVTQTESMIYGYGTLKFVCGDAVVLLQIIQLNLIPVMTMHLKILNYEAIRLPRVPDPIMNGVFQLTSILRSVVGIEASLGSISQSGLLEEICNSLPWTMDDVDVLSNIVRILSVVSGDDICCQVLSNADSLCSSLIRILQVWHEKEDIVVRLTYCLGNLLAKSEDMRIKLFNEQLSFQVIVQLIGFYMESGSPSADDILVKSVRILANWSLNGSIGAELAEEDQLSTMLNTLIADPTSDNVSNELLLCAMSTLNNISYYKDQTSLTVTSIQTADHLFAYLSIPNLEVRTEAMKVLGNFTRSEEVRQRCSTNIGVILSSLVEDSQELLCATIGVLMNIIVEGSVKEEFAKKQGLEGLVNLMDRNEEVGLNLMICQLLWNMVVSAASAETDNGSPRPPQSQLFPRKEAQRLRQLLQKKLKKTSVPKSEEGNEDEGIYQDFTSLARSLHEKLHTLNLC